MDKLRLSLDQLRVESFTTAENARYGRGTVRGRESTFFPRDCVTFQGSTCEPAYTCPECAIPETEVIDC
jgi:hypothetical protein